VPPSAPDSLTFEIGELVTEWLSGSPNYGLRVRAWAGGYRIEGSSSEAGSQGPSLTIAYRGIPD
jgi:hypothetical protein